MVLIPLPLIPSEDLSHLRDRPLLIINFIHRFSLCLGACALVALSGCSWYGFGDTKKDEVTKELTDYARRSEEAGNIGEATDSLSKVAALDSADVEARLELARLHREAGRIDEAIQSLREVVALTPDDSRSWLDLGEMYYQQDDYVTADRCIETALELEPNSLPALMLKAEIEDRRQFEVRALESYHRVLAIEENYPPALLRIARIHLRNNEPIRASVLLRSVCYCRGATPGQIAEARWLLGLSYGQQQRWEDSIESLQLAIDIMEKPGPEDLYYLAYAQYEADQNYEAAQTLKRLRDLNPEHLAAHSLERALADRHKYLTARVQTASAEETMEPISPRGWENPTGSVRVSDRD